MNFLFFDIECANCNAGVSKICEFGYVLTDGNLNIIKSENLLINPQASFNTYAFKRAGIELAYPYHEYYNHPTLNERYEKIKALLTDSNTLPIGFSTDNDANFILSDLKRLKLPLFNFKFVDVLKLYTEGLGRKENLSLDAIFKEQEVDSDIVHHEALNDSIMTLKIFENFCNQVNIFPREILDKCAYSFGELFEGRIAFHNRAFKWTAGNKMTALNKRLVKSFIEERVVDKVDENLKGKFFAFSKEYEKEHFSQTLFAIDKILSVGAKWTSMASMADYLVYFSKEEKQNLYKAKKKRAKVLSCDEFYKIFKINKRNFESGDFSVDDILGKINSNFEWYKKYKKHIN